MINRIKYILGTQTNYFHLGSRLTLILIFTGALIYAGLPILFWILFGEGATADHISQMTIVGLIYMFGPLIIDFGFIGWRLKINSKKKMFRKMKSYLIILIVLIVLYPIRYSLIEAVYELRELIID
jgi:hypothetical protein